MIRRIDRSCATSTIPIRTSVSTFFAFCRRNGYLPKGLPTEAEGMTRFRVRDQRITVLTRGRILAEGDYQTVSSNPEVIDAYVGTGHA